MGVVLLIALWLLVAVCLIVGLALVLPLRLELEIQKEAEWRVLAAIRPFGRHGPRISMKRTPGRTKPDEARKPKRHRKRRAPSRDPRAMFPAVLQFVTDILGCIRVGRLTVNANFGLGDPALTGQAFGMLSPVIYGSPAIPGVQVQVVPVFDRSTLTGAADIAVSVVPILLLGPFVRLGWHVFGPAQ